MHVREKLPNFHWELILLYGQTDNFFPSILLKHFIWALWTKICAPSMHTTPTCSSGVWVKTSEGRIWPWLEWVHIFSWARILGFSSQEEENRQATNHDCCEDADHYFHAGQQRDFVWWSYSNEGVFQNWSLKYSQKYFDNNFTSIGFDIVTWQVPPLILQ